MRQIDSVDIEFIKETFPDPDWTVPDIAEKLGLSTPTIRKYAKQLGKKRPTYTKIIAPRTDWETLWHARKSGKNYEKSAEAAGMSVDTARPAMKRMLNMTEAERIIRWNLYRKANNMPLFAKC